METDVICMEITRSADCIVLRFEGQRRSFVGYEVLEASLLHYVLGSNFEFADSNRLSKGLPRTQEGSRSSHRPRGRQPAEEAAAFSISKLAPSCRSGRLFLLRARPTNVFSVLARCF
jgi:hypothetical protein